MKTLEKPSLENKALAQFYKGVFGDNCRVTRYHHDEIEMHVDIVSCEIEKIGIVQYATIGLSDTKFENFPHRLELVGAFSKEFSWFPNVLATSAFIMMRSGKIGYPGSVMADAMKEYYPTATLPHLFMVDPFYWEDKMHALKLDSKIVNFLQCIPVTDSEMQYSSLHGGEALSALLKKSQIDVLDFKRKSAV